MGWHQTTLYRRNVLALAIDRAAVSPMIRPVNYLRKSFETSAIRHADCILSVRPT